jgi:hypothetical protein
VICIIQQLSNCDSIMTGFTQRRDFHFQLSSRVANSFVHLGGSMRSIELADVALAAAAIFLICAVLLASMPG